jgi:MoxR-like ATPase
MNSLEDMKHIIKRAYHVGADSKRAVMVHGPPGVGKSESVRELANEMGVGFIDKRLAQMDPTDLAGIPYREGTKMLSSVPDWMRLIQAHCRCSTQRCN